MSEVTLFMRMLADEECEAAAFHGEKTFDAKCLDRNYNEFPDDMERCRPCGAREALRRDAEDGEEKVRDSGIDWDF